MLYGLIRIIFFVIIFIIALVFINKSKIIRRKFVIILLSVLCMVICSVSFLLPIENLFVNFKTPQDVFNYSCNGKFEEVIYGNDSCLVFSSNTYNIIPKTESGYKIPTIFSINTVYDKNDINGNFKIYHLINTNDFYIWGTIISVGGDISITDSNNSALKTKITKNGNTNYYTVLIYDFVSSFSDNYYLLINGEKVPLSN